jgi:uncharacterized protein (TIGR03435 family)
MRTSISLLLSTLIALVVGIAAVFAQAAPTFEIVSIKSTAPGGYREGLGSTLTVQPTGRYRALNATIAPIIRNAFRQPDDPRLPQLVNAPAWTTTDPYEIEARFTALPSQTELNAHLPSMLRAMLEERFKLQAHVETRQLPAYALVRARSDGRLGSRLHATTTDCEAYLKEKRDSTEVIRQMRAGDPPPCDYTASSGTHTAGRGNTMAAFAISLTSTAGRYVVNETALDGRFDYDLDYARDPLTQSDLPTIFTALQEQLGLKLESRQAPQNVVVIDHIERPTPD